MIILKKTNKVIRNFTFFSLIEQEWIYSIPVWNDASIIATAIPISTEDSSFSKEPDRYDEEKMIVQVYVNSSGDYIDYRNNDTRPYLIRYINNHGIHALKAKNTHSVCSIGRGANGRWYGWSHRAIISFGLGDAIFDPNWQHPDGRDMELEPFIKRGGKTITTEKEACLAAKRFARYIS